MADRIDRLFDTVDDSADAFLDAIRAGNERAFRFSKIFVEEAQRTQREGSELARLWFRAPLDLVGLTNETLATLTRRQRRRMELGRTMFSELGGIRDETRDTIERVASANRAAARVGVSAGRDAVSIVSDEVSDRADQVSDAMSDAASSLRRNNSRAS